MYFHSCAVRAADGGLQCWGCGGSFDYGQCDVPVGLGEVRSLAAGYTPLPP